MPGRKIEILVGGFIVLALAAFLMLALKVANSGVGVSSETYTLKAKFENVGGLKVRSPVKVGGVVVGRVTAIELDTTYYTPVVSLAINASYNNFPETSSLAIQIGRASCRERV